MGLAIPCVRTERVEWDNPVARIRRDPPLGSPVNRRARIVAGVRGAVRGVSRDP